MKLDLPFLMKMAHSPIRNYAIPGLTSYLIGKPDERGTARLFHSARAHVEPITPHSHRFDFHCHVLAGEVTNRVWTRTDDRNSASDEYAVSSLNYMGQPGKYEVLEQARGRFISNDLRYRAGETYGMVAEQVHSIYFERDTYVLFFEGQTTRPDSVVLEPVVDGLRVPTFKVEPWMFRK